MPDAMPTASSEVRKVYLDRLASSEIKAETLNRKNILIGNARLAVVALGIVFLWLILGNIHATGWIFLIPIVAFIALAIYHNRVIEERDRAKRAVQFYQKGLLRLEDRWQGGGASGIRFSDPQHPYAIDLDLFGTGSLFELLCTARTPFGEECLAGWLKAPSEPTAIRARQVAVKELQPRLDLRESLFVLGADLPSENKTKPLSNWISAPPAPTSDAVRFVGIALSLFAFVAVSTWFATPNHNPSLLYIAMALSAIFQISQFSKVSGILGKVGKPAQNLSVMIQILRRIELEQAVSPYLRELLAKLNRDGVSTSSRIAKLENLLGWQNAMQSSFIAAIAFYLMLHFHLSIAFEKWRQENGGEVMEWLKVVGEFEALCSIAGFSYEHPSDAYPEIVEGEACFVAIDLAHPLLSETQSIRNDISLSPSCQFYIVSGSNMSGKSTLMRSVGANTVLGLMGAPVRAASLQLSVLHLGASIRTQDSLSDGISRFYAEIKRLSQVIEIGKTQPLLFLIDEIMQGTNSHDRRIGAEAVARTLVGQGSLGIMTTHDLALTKFADSSENRSRNVHFEDTIIDGKMKFDYRMRPGVVEKSNALALLRAVGIEV